MEYWQGRLFIEPFNVNNSVSFLPSAFCHPVSHMIPPDMFCYFRCQDVSGVFCFFLFLFLKKNSR
uniref:Uncharacterized protein n=1 Tax=Anguilla anguilla TaxID=7936 RepID=A0A0E9XS36_ANGAN